LVPLQAAKALTLQNAPSIRARMAAGAIPPPRFFEQAGTRRNNRRSDCLPHHRRSKTFRTTSSVDLVREPDPLKGHARSGNGGALICD
jgi:hypothetical protein